MTEEIYQIVKEYIKTRDDNWRFIFGTQMFDKYSLIEKMEKDVEFRKFIIEEVVKTAFDLLLPKKK